MSETLGGLSIIALIFAVVAAWFTHIFICIQASSWGLLIAGAVFFPIGIVHGIGSWFGVF